jgi:thioredoxin 1
VSEAAVDALLVVCLCAQWCDVCEQYRSTFAQVQANILVDHPNTRFAWLDIEDEADLLEPLDVENFPTILMATGNTPRFFGVITPQPQTLERLVRAYMPDACTPVLADASIVGLLGRIRSQFG